MKAKDFKNLLKKQAPELVLEEYMKGKHSKLTEKQLQKIIDSKDEKNKNHGAICFIYKK